MIINSKLFLISVYCDVCSCKETKVFQSSISFNDAALIAVSFGWVLGKKDYCKLHKYKENKHIDTSSSKSTV